MPPIRSALRRDHQRAKARNNLPVSRWFLHTLDRLQAKRDRAKTAPKEDTPIKNTKPNTPTLNASWLPGPPTRLWDAKNHILSGIFVGDEDAAEDLYNDPNWAIIDVREGKIWHAELRDAAENVTHIPLLRKDTRFNAGRKALEEIAEAIDRALRSDKLLLVHCWAGMERSPLATAYWLVTRKGMSLNDAYALLKHERHVVVDRRAWLTKKARRMLEAA